nr:Chain P, pDIQ peptide (12mer) [synthetic construct]3JZQ_Q Chain Q, pDIQ peptide (12mer) [synthetic construct]3JZS_P Chain P, pDIQ peptide (12mer) [synthetic construct]
ETFEHWWSQLLS